MPCISHHHFAEILARQQLRKRPDYILQHGELVGGAHAEDLPVAGLFNFAQTVQVSTGYLSTWMFGEFTAS
jgi:hypothetical protein